MLFLGFFIKLKKVLKEKDNKYMFTMSMIPAISVVICCFMIYRSDKSYEMNVIYTYVAVVGIVIVNVISILLLIMEQKLYEQRYGSRLCLVHISRKRKI